VTDGARPSSRHGGDRAHATLQSHTPNNWDNDGTRHRSTRARSTPDRRGLQERQSQQEGEQVCGECVSPRLSFPRCGRLQRRAHIRDQARERQARRPIIVNTKDKVHRPVRPNVTGQTHRLPEAPSGAIAHGSRSDLTRNHEGETGMIRRRDRSTGRLIGPNQTEGVPAAFRHGTIRQNGANQMGAFQSKATREGQRMTWQVGHGSRRDYLPLIRTVRRLRPLARRRLRTC